MQLIDIETCMSNLTEMRINRTQTHNTIRCLFHIGTLISVTFLTHSYLIQLICVQFYTFKRLPFISQMCKTSKHAFHPIFNYYTCQFKSALELIRNRTEFLVRMNE